jgi:hypothetical protein
VPAPDHPTATAARRHGRSGISRRAALTGLGATALLAVGGCRLGPDDEVAGASKEQRDADEVLVEAAVRDLQAARDLADRTMRRHVGLSPVMTPLVTLHDAHLGLLDATAERPGRAPAVAGRSGPALTRVRAAEQRLQEQLATHAATATSGTLARALASMSAAVAQHVAVLPQPTDGPA